jgi:hypothetical protein
MIYILLNISFRHNFILSQYVLCPRQYDACCETVEKGWAQKARIIIREEA